MEDTRATAVRLCAGARLFSRVGGTQKNLARVRSLSLHVGRDTPTDQTLDWCLALGNADEAIAVEHRIYSVDGWCLDVVVQTAQLLANL